MLEQEHEILAQRLRQLKAQKQSPDREAEVTRLRFKLEEIEHSRAAKIAKRALLFFESYLKNGFMEAVHPSGARLRGKPVTNVSGVQAIWNIRSEAQKLANWSTP